MKSPYDIHNSVRAHRLQNELTQQELAERVGVTRQTILSIEKGKYAPSVGLALALATALGVTVETLFRLSERENHD
jgi:putative transcriptional regulator